MDNKYALLYYISCNRLHVKIISFGDSLLKSLFEHSYIVLLSQAFFLKDNSSSIKENYIKISSIDKDEVLIKSKDITTLHNILDKNKAVIIKKIKKNNFTFLYKTIS